MRRSGWSGAASWFSSGDRLRARRRGWGRERLQSDRQIRPKILRGVDLSCLSLETARLDGHFVVRARRNAKRQFARMVGRGFPAKLLFVGAAQARPRAIQGEPSFVEHRSENQEIVRAGATRRGLKTRRT